MDQVIDFFTNLFDTSDWPPRWFCGQWTEFHGWLYIISDLLIWSAYFVIPMAIIQYITRKSDAGFIRLYVLFAAFILACGFTHLLDAIAFWFPLYRFSALIRMLTGIISWITVFYLIKLLPVAFSLRTQHELETEIEQRKKAEEQIMVLNTLLEKIVAEKTAEISDYKYAMNESCIVAITDQKGIIKHVNDNFCKISKYSREELIGNDHRMINSGYHTKVFIRELWVTIASGKIWKGILKNKAKDGTFYWVDTTIVPFLNEHGKPYQYIAIRADITERKQAEDEIIKLNMELTKNERRFRAMLENSNDVISLLDENFTTIYRSVSAERITGWANEDQKGTTRFDLIHPDDLVQVKSKYIEMMAYPGKPFWVSYRHLHKNGYYIWMEGTEINMLDDSSLNGIVSNLRDVTERKEAEEKIARSEKIYKTIASSIPGSVICLFDTDYRYLLIEGDMLEKLGYSKEKLLGNKAEDVVPPERFAKVLPSFERVFKGEVFTIEDSRLKYDTVTRFVPLKDENEHVYGAMTVSFDVSELKDAQRAIAELNMGLEHKVTERTAQLEAANKELEAFSYSISHDLRAPLRAVNGYAMMLQEDYEILFDDNGKRLLKVIRDNAEQMGALIDDLLAFAKLGRKDIQKTSVDMTELTGYLVQEINMMITHQAEIKIHKLHDVMADGMLIKQVMMNLILNAIKYSSKTAHPIVEISSEVTDDEIVYSISDNGAGFDMVYVHKLFGVFQRLHTSEEFEGTGVGLAIVKRIINKHNGRVWAEGILEKGATFYFSLPKL